LLVSSVLFRTENVPEKRQDDIQWRDGPIRGEFPDAKIIVRTTYESDVGTAMKLGARAYLVKTRLDKEVLRTIRTIYSGK